MEMGVVRATHCTGLSVSRLCDVMSDIDLSCAMPAVVVVSLRYGRCPVPPDLASRVWRILLYSKLCKSKRFYPSSYV